MFIIWFYKLKKFIYNKFIYFFKYINIKLQNYSLLKNNFIITLFVKILRSNIASTFTLVMILVCIIFFKKNMLKVKIIKQLKKHIII